MHQTAWKTTSTTTIENWKIWPVWQNQKKTETMTDSDECAFQHAVLSAWNRRQQDHVNHQLSDWQDSQLNSVIYQQKVSFREREEWDVQQLWKICEKNHSSIWINKFKKKAEYKLEHLKQKESASNYATKFK